jgi:hypothetical protein
MQPRTKTQLLTLSTALARDQHHPTSIQSVGARACVLKLEYRTGSVGSSQTNFNFVFCVSAMPCHQDEVDMTAPDPVLPCTPTKPTGNGIRILYGPDWMQLDRCGEHNANSHDDDKSKYLNYDQIVAISDAVTFAPRA